jgi:hypothetical protein
VTEELRAWIAKAPFRFARTMPENPHWYIVQREHGGPEFDALVHCIEEEGATRHFRGWP